MTSVARAMPHTFNCPTCLWVSRFGGVSQNQEKPGAWGLGRARECHSRGGRPGVTLLASGKVSETFAGRGRSWKPVGAVGGGREVVGGFVMSWKPVYGLGSPWASLENLRKMPIGVLCRNLANLGKDLEMPLGSWGESYTQRSGFRRLLGRFGPTQPTFGLKRPHDTGRNRPTLTDIARIWPTFGEDTPNLAEIGWQRPKLDEIAQQLFAVART